MPTPVRRRSGSGNLRLAAAARRRYIAARGRNISRQLEIAVAGCGTAGMAAALLLHRDGHKVTLFERFDEPRSLGSGLLLQPSGLAVLAAMGLGEAAIGSGARIDRIRGEAAGRIVLDVRYSALPAHQDFAIGIHRAALFNLLHRSVEADGIPVRTGRAVCRSPAGISNRLSFENARDEGPFDLIVDALGMRSPLAPRTGHDLAYGALWANVDLPGGLFDAAALSQRYWRASTMAGVLPVGAAPGRSALQAAFFWSLRADHLASWQDRGLPAWKAEVTALWPATVAMLEQIISPDQLTFARYAHRTLGRPAEPGMIHIGDSWHSTSPQLGQGANMALLDAFALAKGLRDSCGDLADALPRTVKLRSSHVRLYQLLSAALTPVYQSDSRLIPLVRDRVMGPLSRVPPFPWLQAALVSGLVGRPLHRLGIDFAPGERLAKAAGQRRAGEPT